MVRIQWSSMGGLWYKRGGDSDGKGEDENREGPFGSFEEKYIKTSRHIRLIEKMNISFNWINKIVSKDLIIIVLVEI